MIESNTIPFAEKVNGSDYGDNSLLPRLLKNYRAGISAISIALVMAGCGPGVSASGSNTFTPFEASCGNRITDEAIIEARKNDFRHVLANEDGNVEAAEQRMEEYCEGIIPPDNQ